MSSVKNKVLQGIDTVIVRVSDIRTAKTWYQEKLGLEPLWEDENIKLIVLETDSPTSLTLWQTDQRIENNRETASYPIFRTADARLAREELVKRGVEAAEVVDDGVVQYFFFYDPDGNILEACQVHA